MSRVAKKPVAIPKGVEVKLDGLSLSFKGPKGQMIQEIHPSVKVEVAANELRFDTDSEQYIPMAGTMRSLAQNNVQGVTSGFEIKLQLVGVGYRAQMQGTTLNLALGFSHPINFPVPAGITIETPSQTEIVVKGADRQKVGQVSANIRGFRPPEPYKGKGVKYLDEVIFRKEAKKK
ncbi:50S ribosomal protein L6 [Halothiobacillus diazotrophicus]|uniref:Large ribosomal subunit protein uL6 n=1 Tax=Halothiobacillus diazotrophicus TaxID=1860122 RepID=A0A191ZIP6_9GAMM|nr:50S ribosomal protein L6 [Halothiobacillus diazotrophicus]ANJ67771.1 50S ribosomal protein L6 [Halothiobacillus diazotrophicus]